MHSKRKKLFLIGKRAILCDQFSNRIHGIWRDTALHSLKTHDSLHTTHVHLPKHIETYILGAANLFLPGKVKPQTLDCIRAFRAPNVELAVFKISKASTES